MTLRSILGGLIALPLLCAAAAATEPLRPASDSSLPGVFVPIPGTSGSGDAGSAPVRLAQAGDPRITALEEQVRQLSGTIEELNFQILQMQEQIRKMQEDNEFRFQELENKRSDAGGGPQVAARSRGDGEAGSETSAGTEPRVRAAEPAPSEDPAAARAPRTLGRIVVDEQGNITGAQPGELAPAPSGGQAGDSSGETVAALPTSNDPTQLYRDSYQFILSGDYATAEQGFRTMVDRFPSDPKAADAHFWLGEAQLGQRKYRDAAETFLNASKQFPKSKKAPEMMLKLGISLAGMNQRDVACATFGEISKRYPQSSAALKERVKQEQALAAC